MQTNGSMGDVKETKRFENKMNRSLWRGNSLFMENREPQAYIGLRSCVSALWSRSSNRLRVIVFLDACRHSEKRKLSAT